ncbi:MAG TPA: GNAT family N-acetyltransferase [Puia sp.]|nr:GNAT family N-acetyltransferase [Puia sp.]
MLIQNKQVGNKGLFYVGQDGAILAELVYNVPSPGKMVIEHTEVDESLKGKNVGHELVETAVNYARTHHMKIVPLCPFAKALINRTKEWQDVLE